MNTWWPYARLASAALAAAAIVAQLALTLQIAIDSPTPYGGHLPTVIANFFSFFTIESNVIAAVALAIGGIWGLRTRDAAAEPRWLAVLLVCASTYMIVTGIVYNALLRGLPLPQGATVPWSNEVLHVVIPLIMLADVLFAPRRRRLGWSAVTIAALFPIVWVVYTLLRSHTVISPSTGEAWWFPYPFLNWHRISPGEVTMYVIGIAVVIIGIAALVVWVGRRRGIRSVEQQPSPAL
ncbi:Pr6Pr family membrane protein [Microbacterium sp. ZW T5_45]|uniref:Pr6Pr family membrane protein n=1 Tax=Microbacterium sp. ZW T5_45 TaxID=3378080 RepID=UPI003852512A